MNTPNMDEQKQLDWNAPHLFINNDYGPNVETVTSYNINNVYMYIKWKSVNWGFAENYGINNKSSL